MFPGLADAHLHLLGVGKALEIADLKGAASAAEAASRMARSAATLPARAWVEGRGWDQNLWPGRAFPDAAALDARIPDRPSDRNADFRRIVVVVDEGERSRPAIRTGARVLRHRLLPWTAGGQVLRRRRLHRLVDREGLLPTRD